MTINSTTAQKSRWLPSLLHQQGKFILAIPVTCLVTSLCAFGWLQFKTVQAEYLVQHTQKVRLEVQRLLTALLDAESAGRGYEITRRQEFITSYKSAIADIPDSLDQLNQLVADNPSQTQRLQEIRVLATARVTILKRFVQLVGTQAQNMTQSPEIISQVIEGKQAMDRTKAQINQFIAEEERLQTDRDQRLKQQQQLTWFVLALSAWIGIGGSVLAAYLLNRLAHKLSEHDRKLKESEARYRVLIENFPNGAVVLFDPELRYLIAGGTGLAAVDLSKEQLEGKTIWESFPRETCEAIEPLYREAIAGRATTVEIPYANRIYLIYTLPVRHENGQVYAGMVMTQDITEHKQSEQQLSQVNRALKTLSECNQTLVRATDEQTLLQNICHNIVEFGSYCSAWIAFAEQDEAKSVRPAAQVGFEDGFLESLQITWSDTERGHGPTGTAIRTGKVSIVQDILTDPSYLPWREAAVKQGYGSSIALPLIVEAKPLGALDIFAAEAGAFDEAEVKLLTELANDLAYGIAALRTQVEHRQAEAALGESQQRLDSILSSMEDVVWSTSATTYEVLYLNQATAKIYGRSPQEFFDNPNLWFEVVHPEDYEPVSTFNQSLLEQGSLAMEYRILRPDGQVRWLYDRGRVTYDESGMPSRLDGIATDITDRKLAEEMLKLAQFSIDRASDGIFWVGSDAQILRVNEAACQLMGYSEVELLNMTVHDLEPQFSAQVWPSHWNELKERATMTFESSHKQKDGKVFPTEVNINFFEFGGKEYNFSFVRDITKRKQVQESLRDNEAKFRAFLESASEAIIVTDANGAIVIFNAKAKELFGYDPTEVLGHTVEFLMPQRFHQRHVEHRATYREEPTKRSMSKTKNLFARRKNGTEFPIEAGLSPIQTKDGTFVMTFLSDITERKQAEEEIKRLNESLKRRVVEVETRYQQIVELAEEGIWVIDSEAQTTYVNQAMARMLGYTEEEMLGRLIFDFMDEVALHNANIERRKHGLAEKHEFKLKAKDGKTVWVYMSTSPVLDENGKLLWSCALVYDITERKQADEQLRDSTERISLANAELARATRLKDEFLASMSHELRTPLNAILGLAEALQEEVYGSLTDRQRRSLSTIEHSGRHLLELITEILDLSKIESGKMELQIAPVFLPSLCESSLAFVKQQAHHKRITLNFKMDEGLEEVELDERRIRQVLVNLLSNAVKFTPDGGEVWLGVEANPDREILQFRVIDTGLGIAPENIEKLFKPFVQLDSSLSRRYAGTGLGLALVRRIAELHGGSVSLESEVGKGSQFTVTLPWKKPYQKIVSEREQAELELPSIHQALIVEDSDAAAKQVARYLAELGSAAYIHPQGEGAVEAALRLDPEVIVLDLLLPNISGWEVLAQLKADPRTKDIPVLVISVMDERSRALALGASEYLTKPISRQQLQSVLSKIISPVSQHPGNTALVVIGEAGHSAAMPQTEQLSPLVLLAEDNEANISIMSDYLQIQGYRVSLARNGIEAVQQAKQQKPDLILMDIQMPEMDGLEATYRIRAEADLAAIPIIAITALAMPGDRERCLAAGATDYLTKPVSLKNLVNIIEQNINGH
ncbi:MAG TPA: PAS domain S-box protein [Coleofasciculaceae cyanobacterium]|jgi:PAS domain S-box-containing protein